MSEVTIVGIARAYGDSCRVLRRCLAL